MCTLEVVQGYLESVKVDTSRERMLWSSLKAKCAAQETRLAREGRRAGAGGGGGGACVVLRARGILGILGAVGVASRSRRTYLASKVM